MPYGLICPSQGLKAIISMASITPRTMSAARSHCGLGPCGITTTPPCSMQRAAQSAMVTSCGSPIADSDGPPLHSGWIIGPE